MGWSGHFELSKDDIRQIIKTIMIIFAPTILLILTQLQGDWITWMIVSSILSSIIVVIEKYLRDNTNNE